MRADQAAIDLHARERQPLQRRERRVAGAEVVERDADAQLAQAMQRRDRRRAGLQHVLGQLDLQALRRQAVPAQQAFQALDEVAVEELLRRDVDRDARARPRPALPERSRLDGAAQRPVADVGDQAGLLARLRRNPPVRSRCRPAAASAAAPRRCASPAFRNRLPAGTAARTRPAPPRVATTARP